jgi:predicted branched-subunit amino acid permease
VEQVSAMDGLREFPSSSRSFFAGVLAAWMSIFCPVIGGTYIGLGALAHDFGLSLLWMTISTVVVWAGPAQLVVMSAFAAGAATSPIEVALGVTLTGMRLFPMVVALLPLLRPGAKTNRDFILPTHFTSISMWVESLRLLPSIEPRFRIPFCNGLACGFMSVAMLCGAVGYHLAAGMPPLYAAGLSCLTPLSFMMSTAKNCRQLLDYCAFVFGVVLGPLLAWYQVGLDLMWSGVIGGVAAYAIHRMREATR